MDAIISHCPLLLELIKEVLLRLPVKSLLRFRTVCKQWRDIITSLSFMHKHFHHESNQVRLLVRWPGSPEGSYDDDVYGFSLYMGQKLERYEEPDHLLLPGQIYAFSVPCNGVFCVSNIIRGPCKGVFLLHTTERKLLLWNPATRRIREVPSPPCSYSAMGIGFGFDDTTQAYKIVVIVDSGSEFYVYVFSSKLGYWEKLERPFRLRNSYLVEIARTPAFSSGRIPTFYDGCYYWRIFHYLSSTYSVLEFDMQEEVIRSIRIPGMIAKVEREEYVELDHYKDSLALFNFCTNAANRYFEIWIYKEKVWTRIHSLDVQNLNFSSPLGFWEGDKVVFHLRDDNDGVLTVHDLNSNTRGRVRYAEIQGEQTRHVCIFNYKQSLISLGLGETSTVGADADEDRIELLLSQVKCEDVTELIAAGREELVAGGGAVAMAAPAGGAGGSDAPAAAESKKAEKVEEPEVSDDDMGFSLFD